MTLTFQKEVAERMIAPVMTAQRCRLSVMCQNWCAVDYKFTIPGIIFDILCEKLHHCINRFIFAAREFKPKPKVEVGVVHFQPHIQPIIPLPFDLVEKVVKALFSSRQKFCNNTLK